jgi:uncharacterized membrane protein
MSSIWGVSGWILATAILGTALYRVLLWWIPVLVTDIVLNKIKQAGRKTNLLYHQGVNNADNCRIPLSISDALISSCMFDVSAHPLRIVCFMPEDSYWSISFYARNTDNFFVINDLEVRENHGKRISLVLVDKHHRHEPDGDETVISAPSSVGFVIVRMMVKDPQDPGSLQEVAEVQKKALSECVYRADSEPDSELGRWELHGTVPGGEEFRTVLPSLEKAEEWVRSEFSYSLPVQTLLQGEPSDSPGGVRFELRNLRPSE